MNREAPGATAGLVLGILSVVFFPPLGIFGLVQSNRALAAIREEPRLTGAGSARAGKILSVISLALIGLSLLVLILVLTLSAVAGGP